MQHVRDIPFEVGKQHQLGLRTELSALRIVSDVAKKLKAKARRMILPPKPPSWTRSVGECDAILLSDVAVFLVEVTCAAKVLIAGSVEREVRGWEKTSDHAPRWITVPLPPAASTAAAQSKEFSPCRR